jgi:peptidyl-prolyl cis-trans isomerase SurA
MRRICAMFIAGAVIGSAPRVCGEVDVVNGIVAVVDTSILTFGEVLNLSEPAEQVLMRQYRNQPEEFDKRRTEARIESREQLLQRQLVLHDFEASLAEPERRAVVDKLIAKEVDQEVEKEIRLRYSGSRMAMVRTLQAEGLTMERHRQQIRDRIIVTWMREKNISSEMIVSPHRVEAYYLVHRDDEKYKLGAEVKVRMIVLNCLGDRGVGGTARLAEEILRKLKEGATFAEMATLYSEGSQRSQGGDWGWCQLNKRLADTAAALQPGQHSGVLGRSAGENDCWVYEYTNGVRFLARRYVVDATLKKEEMVEQRPLGTASAATNLPPPMEFYLMLVEDKRPARSRTLAEVRDQIERDLLTAERIRLEKQYISRLEKKTFVAPDREKRLKGVAFEPLVP